MDQKQYTTKTTLKKRYRTDLFPLVQKKITDKIKLSRPPDLDPNYTIIQVFNLHDPLDNIPLSKRKLKIFIEEPQRKRHWNCNKNIKTLNQSLDNLNLGTFIKHNP